jgi:hypothetical protein
MKLYKSFGINLLPTQLHQRGNRAVHSQKHKLSVFWCKREFPQYLKSLLCIFPSFILWRMYSLLGNDSVYMFQRTHNNRSCVLYGPCYKSLLGNTTILIIEEVFSMWSTPCPVLDNEPVNTHSDTEHVFSVRSYPSLYNESLFVAMWIRELELENLVEFWWVGSPRWLNK